MNAIEFLERFNALMSKKQTAIGFMGELEELAAGAQSALDDANQMQLDLDQANETLTLYERGGAA